MGTPARRLIQDQNLNTNSTGALLALLGGKVDVSRTTNKGAVGGRRALEDITNSGKPSAVQPSTKNKSINVVSAGKDLAASKAYSSKNQEKGKQRRNKALSDITNTAAPALQHLYTKTEEKFGATAGENAPPSAIKEEEAFLETVGLDKAREPCEMLGNGRDINDAEQR